MCCLSFRLCLCMFGRRSISTRWNQSNVWSGVAQQHAQFQRACNTKTSRWAFTFYWLSVFTWIKANYRDTLHFFCFTKATGKWCMRVTSWWRQCSIHLSKVSEHTIVSFVLYLHQWKQASADFINRLGSCRLGHKTDPAGLGWVEGHVENKKQLSI